MGRAYSICICGVHLITSGEMSMITSTNQGILLRVPDCGDLAWANSPTINSYSVQSMMPDKAALIPSTDHSVLPELADSDLYLCMR